MTANNALGQNKTKNPPQSSTIFKTQVDEQKKTISTQNAFIKITNQIRRSLDCSVICETVTKEMLPLLRADRVAIYRFNPDWSGRFISEARSSEWIPLVEAQQNNDLISKNVSDCSVRQLDTHKAADTHLQVTYGGAFVQGEVFRVCEDIHNAGFSNCYIDVLESYQARSYVVIAIYLNNRLWGLLAAYQNSGPRRWKETEIQLLVQVSEQLGIALKQAEYVQTIQNQTTQLNETLQQLKQSQAQLVQGEKMASLGQLVAGIAHEINNPINFIHGNLTHVEDYMGRLIALVQSASAKKDENNDVPILDLDDNLNFILEDLPKTLASIRSGSARIRDIVLSLRNFSRLDESGIKQVDMHEGIESTLVILSNQLAASGKHPKIEVIKDYCDVLPIECDPAQINQVILALLTNAIYSLKAAGWTEETDAAGFSHLPHLWISTQVNEQNQAVIRIQDNGLGIDKSHHSKVFDHFFTTKPMGEGSGLGLAIARQIVENNHGGTLSLDKTVEQGAAFVIQLPISR